MLTTEVLERLCDEPWATPEVVLLHALLEVRDNALGDEKLGVIVLEKGGDLVAQLDAALEGSSNEVGVHCEKKKRKGV